MHLDTEVLAIASYPILRDAHPKVNNQSAMGKSWLQLNYLEFDRAHLPLAKTVFLAVDVVARLLDLSYGS